MTPSNFVIFSSFVFENDDLVVASMTFNHRSDTCSLNHRGSDNRGVAANRQHFVKRDLVAFFAFASIDGNDITFFHSILMAKGLDYRVHKYSPAPKLAKAAYSKIAGVLSMSIS